MHAARWQCARWVARRRRQRRCSVQGRLRRRSGYGQCARGLIGKHRVLGALHCALLTIRWRPLDVCQTVAVNCPTLLAAGYGVSLFVQAAELRWTGTTALRGMKPLVGISSQLAGW